jgi:hypothetical protein
VLDALISSVTFLATALFLAIVVMGSLVEGDFTSLNTSSPLLYL